MNIKQLLDETMPKDLHFSEREKQQVRTKVHTTKKSSFRFVPQIAAVALIALISFLLVPSLYDQEQTSVEIVESIVIPDVPYTSLIRSTYIEETNELIYPTSEGLFSYQVDSKSVNQLVATTSPGIAYSYVATKDWLVWEESSDQQSALLILNRETGTQNQLISNEYTRVDLSLENNILTYLNFGTDIPSYWSLNLDTLEEEQLHKFSELDGMGFSDRSAGQIVLSARVGDTTTLYLYEEKSGELMGEFKAPYPAIHQLQLVENRIYGDFATEDGKMTFGYITINDGSFTQVETPTYWKSTVHGEYVALDVADKTGIDTTNVELFRINGDELVRVSTFPSIKERLVVPEFTEQGILRVIEENFTSGGPTLHLIKPK